MRVWRRTVLWGIVFVALLLVAFPFALFALTILTTDGRGSMQEAMRLRALVEPVADPESGRELGHEYRAHRFENGEWILGIGRDSHGVMAKYWGGGTVVVKDSRGDVRCFFGHVYGPGGHDSAQGKSLDEYYRAIVQDLRLIEQQWPGIVKP